MTKVEWESQKNYKYLLDIYERRKSCPDEEIIEAIKSECDFKRIVNAEIDNGGNQVAVLGLIIEEAGNRKLNHSAKYIVEYVGWPRGEDFFVHIVPKALNALININDKSIINRLKEIAMFLPTHKDAIKKTIIVIENLT